MPNTNSLPAPSDLAYFIEIAATLNISRAAERLGISQPSLSLAVKRLEDAVGTALLVRSKSGVRLTRAGERVRQEAASLLDDWERLRSEATRDETEVRGRFTLGCHQSVALYSLPSFLPQLLREHPAIEVTLVHDLSRRITEDVISFKVDIGIVVNPAPHPDLVIKKLCKDDVTFWTWENPSTEQNPKDGKAILALDPELLQSQYLIQEIQRSNMKFSRYLPSSSLEVITSLVAAGAAVGILPARVATRSKYLKLKRLGADSPCFVDEVCVIYRADTLRSKGGKEIVNAVADAFKNA